MDLNQDVLLEIFGLVSQGTRATLLNATLVNQRWHTVAQLFIDKTIELTLCLPYKVRNLHVLRRLQRSPALQGRALHLTVRDCHTKQRVPTGQGDEPPVDVWSAGQYFGEAYELIDAIEPGIQAQFEAISSVIPVSRLESFSWAAIPPLPLTIATSLAAVKHIDIHIKLNPAAIGTAAWSYAPVANRAVLRRLRPLTANLVSLQLCLPNEDDRGNLVLHAVNEITQACPKLQELKLHSLGRLSAHSAAWCPSGASGPAAELATQSRVAKYRHWSTNQGEVRPTAKLHDVWTITPSHHLSLAPTLSSLSLQNFCICKQKMSTTILHMPAIRMLELSCLLFLKDGRGSRLRLKSFTLTLAKASSYHNFQALGPERSVACTTFWPPEEVGEVLSRVDGLQELRIHGNTDAVSNTSFLHLGMTLRRLVHLSSQPYDCQASLHGFQWDRATLTSLSIPWTRMTDLPEFLDLLGTACPLLEELHCDAPNPSTQVSTRARSSYQRLADFERWMLSLDAIVRNFRNLKHLHFRRSPEPYCNTIRANQYSYARFTTPSVIVVWKLLSRVLPLLTLKVTIGEAPSWDECSGGILIAPNVPTRSFLIRRTDFDVRKNDLSVDYHITQCQQAQANTALAEHRPGPLSDYWKIQSSMIDEDIKPQNDPIFPRSWLDNGVDRRPTCRLVSHEALRDPVFRERRAREARDRFHSLQAQHDAQVKEAMHPTREYY